MYIKSLCAFVLTLTAVLNSYGQDFDNYGWTFYNKENKSLENNMVSEIVFDKKGNAWATTNGMGMAKFDGSKWTIVKKYDSLAQGWLKEIIVQPDGKFLITGILGYLYLFDPDKQSWESIPTPGGVQFLSVTQNNKGVYLLGTAISHSSLYQYHKGVFRLIEKGKEDVMGINLEPDGDALVSFRNGLYRYKMKPDGTYDTTKEKLSDIAFYEVEPDNKGTLWGASYSGTHLFNSSDTSWTEFKDLPESIYYDFNGQWKYCIHNVMVLKDQRIMISTQFGAHLAVYDHSKWKTYSIPLNGEFDGIESIQMAPDGSIWIATWHHGIVVFSNNKDKKYPKIPLQQSQQPDKKPDPPSQKPKIQPKGNPNEIQPTRQQPSQGGQLFKD